MTRTRFALTICIFVVVLASAFAISMWESDVASNIAAIEAGSFNPYREFNEWLNTLFFNVTQLSQFHAIIYQQLGETRGYYFASYARDLIGGSILYWVTAGVWHIVIYRIRGHELFTSRGRPFPSTETIVDQMQLAQASMFLYAALPILSEFLIENGFTKVYFYTEQVGGVGGYLALLALYLFLVEIGIYWMHRTLHTNKFLYKYIHALHHKYNKETTLTPWCSVAFNPIDGILQASPYVVFLFVVPVHYFTHIFLLFFSAVWATNIHDALWGDTEPVMGSKYHTIHHTHYHCNFGQFFTFCDYYWGTLKVPEKSDIYKKAK